MLITKLFRSASAVLIALLCTAVAVHAQSGAIKGFVYDRATGEPMTYTNVVLTGTSFAAQTDLNGYYSITQIPSGNYTLFTTQLGYDSTTKEVTVGTDGRIVSVNLYLRRADSRMLKEVQVSGTKTKKVTQSNVGITTISPRELKALPSAGGEPDLAQYLQVMPGVTFTGDQGGQLYIRGGAPSQTGILLDGVTIYNPFHTIGLYSVFETDAIRTVDVHSAGFNAEYGNRISAILDVRTKDGNRNRLSGKASVSPIMARTMLEGPIKKSKGDQDGALTFLIAAKHSYLKQTSTSLYSGAGDAFSNGLPYTFTDLYGKITLSAANGSKLNLFGFNFDDKATFNRPNTNIAAANFNWKATGAGTNFVVSPSGSSTLITGKFAYSKYNIEYKEAGTLARTRTSNIDGFEAAINFTNFLPAYSQLKYGIEVSGFHTGLDYVNSLNFPTTLDRRNTLASFYTMLRKNFNQKLVVEPGIRLQYYSTLSVARLEPRIQAKYNISPNVRLKGAAGMYSQNIISSKSDRDIVNFFTGFLLSPDQTTYDADNQPVKNNLLTAIHFLGGLEVDVRDIEFNLEPWTKIFTQTIELNRNKLSASDPDYQAGNGRAYGLDLTAKYNKDRFFIWTAFSYQQVDNTFLVPATSTAQPSKKQTYPTPFDRRFNMNLLGSYQAGAKKEWETSLRYNMGSPFPFTQTQGFYEMLNVTSNGVGTNYLNQNGQLGILYANDVNQGRLSWYHRVDLSIKRRFTLSTTTNLETTLAITNVLDRSNIFYVDRIENTRVYQLPFFPSINVTLNF